jgi:microcystin-dependent protein
MPTTPILQLPYPESQDSADVPRDIKALADKLDPLGTVPVGSMMIWPAASAPAGVTAEGNPLWLLMLGQVVLAASYPGLVPVLGAAGGNITIPDMRDMFPQGAGAAALLTTGGASSVALADAQMPGHTHNVNGSTGPSDRSLAHGHNGYTSYGAEHNHVAYGAGAGGRLMHNQNWSQGGVGFQPYIGGGATWLYYIDQVAAAGGHSHTTVTTDGAAPDHLHGFGVVSGAAGGGAAHENRPPFRAVNFIIRAG